MLILSKSFQFPEKCDPVTATAAAIGALAGGASIREQRKAASQQKKAYRAEQKARKTQQRLEEFRAAREKRKGVREAMVLRSQLANQAAVTGTAGSSGIAGGMAGVQNRAASNIFAMNVQEGFGRSISGYLEDAASARSRAGGYQSRAATYGAISNTAMTIFQGYNAPATGGGGTPSTLDIGGQTYDTGF